MKIHTDTFCVVVSASQAVCWCCIRWFEELSFIFEFALAIFSDCLLFLLIISDLQRVKATKLGGNVNKTQELFTFHIEAFHLDLRLGRKQSVLNPFALFVNYSRTTRIHSFNQILSITFWKWVPLAVEKAAQILQIAEWISFKPCLFRVTKRFRPDCSPV